MARSLVILRLIPRLENVFISTIHRQVLTETKRVRDDPHTISLSSYKAFDFRVRALGFERVSVEAFSSRDATTDQKHTLTLIVVRAKEAEHLPVVP